MSIKKRGELFCIAIVVLLFLLASCNSNKITGFAVSEENATSISANETTIIDETTTTTETQADKEKKEKPEKEVKEEKVPEEKPKKPKENLPPVWKSDVEEFTLKGKTSIDLSQYFYDANNDSLAYLYTTPEKIEIDVDGSIITLTPKGHNFTTTISFTATDGDKATTKEIKLIVPEKRITISLVYDSDSIYDADNDGYEPTAGVIDLTVKNSQFSWDADESKLCTRWQVEASGSEESTTVCYGNEKCCNFVGIAPARDKWNEVFYSTYGQYGAIINNTISAQILYVDYGLSIDEPFAEIYFSDWKELAAKYYFASIDFENVCVDTCILKDFNDTSYKLIFEIDNAVLNFDILRYSILEEISKVLFDLFVKDDKGLKSGEYELYKEDILVQKEEYIEPDYYTIKITPSANVFEKLVIEKVNITKPVSTSIGIDNVTREISIEDVDVKKKYAVDLERLEFEKATLTATANANALYKCKQWDYEREVCFGEWVKIKDLAPGQQYNLSLTPEDPAFIEGDINFTITPINVTGLALIKEIPNITIGINKNATLNLSTYFSNINESATFTYFNQSGINILFENDLATIVPDKNFSGTVYTFITATQNGNSVISNLFSITVAEISVNITPNLILKKKDFKLDEDIDLDFEYLAKQELVKENKWKEEYEVFEEKTEKTEQELELLKQKIVKKEKQKKKWQSANENIEAFVYDNEGRLKDMDIEIEELREGKFDIRLPKPRAFKAGKYTIKLELVKDGITYTQEQDFTWGVLAVNVNKSIYLPNEDALIGIGVLDDRGKIVCSADVTLEITNPLNQTARLTTTNNDIKISPECTTLGVTQLPDYYANYKVGDVGNYLMNLTAVTSNGIRSVQDNFTVQSSVDFDVARQAATRIYPLVPYTTKISITANQNYNGVINEYVPSSFDISEVEIYEVEQKSSETTLSGVEDSKINGDLISKIENNQEENKGFRGHLTLTSLSLDESPTFNYDINKYLNLCIEPENNKCKGYVAQWIEPLFGERRDAGSNFKEEIKGSQNLEFEPKVRSHLNQDNSILLFKTFGLEEWRTVGWQNQELRSTINRVGSHLSGFKTQRELRVPALPSTNSGTLFDETNLINKLSNFFTLIPSASAQINTLPTITTLNDTKIISIPANLKKGSKYILSYKFDAPDISPEFYVLGPLDIGAFKETRQWQIANDAPATGFYVAYKDSNGNYVILEDADVSNENPFFINKSGVLYSESFSSPWIKLIPEIRTKKGANWFNFTLLDFNLSKITVLNNNTQQAILRFDYNKTVGATKTYAWEEFIFDSSNNYVLINFSMNLTINVDDSYFKLNLQEIAINNTQNNDFATFVTAGGTKRFVNITNPNLDVTRKRSQVNRTYFEIVDEDTGKYAWIFYNIKDIGVNETYHIKGGNYPNALADFATQGSSLNAGVYTISWAWNEPVKNKKIAQHFETTRANATNLPKDFYIKKDDEYVEGDYSSWPYSPLVTDTDTTYFYVNASLLNSQELFPASKTIEVNSSTNYSLSFYIANVSFQSNLEEYGNIWYIEFDENGNEQDHGDIVIFNSSDAWTDHPHLFSVAREALTEWTKINVSFTTLSTTRYVKFEPYFQNIRTNAGYSIDNIELVER